MKEILFEDANDLINEASDKYNFVARVEGESGRWNKDIQIIFSDVNKPEDLFAFNYSEGLTEEQESTIVTVQHYEVSLYDSYPDDTVEVYPVKKVIKQIVDYVPIDQEAVIEQVYLIQIRKGKLK